LTVVIQQVERLVTKRPVMGNKDLDQLTADLELLVSTGTWRESVIAMLFVQRLQQLLQSLILAHAFHDAPFDLTTIHDSAGCLPNHFDEMCARYRTGFAKATQGDILGDIARQWNVEQEVMRFEGTEWRNEIPESVYLFN
tara:strand:+ start:497 stop:916 length:420 start_codon:yes stop_codon:yes gene_type:complete